MIRNVPNVPDAPNAEEPAIIRWFYEIVGEDEDADVNGLIQILDEEVPLADAPLTGDISLLLAAMSLISLGGAVMLKKKED